ncbi:T9SS type A sorting domain-containing protein [candidate division FCPU426 bacterium]|nr:T9SS type A sorting domain-containing protein [candidate division FCPU426 bacterium]
MLRFYYCLESPAVMKITIYNVIGEKCIGLEDRHTEAGYFQTLWDISRVSPGVYFYRAEIVENSRTRKLPVKKLVIVR